LGEPPARRNTRREEPAACATSQYLEETGSRHGAAADFVEAICKMSLLFSEIFPSPVGWPTALCARNSQVHPTFPLGRTSSGSKSQQSGGQSQDWFVIVPYTVLFQRGLFASIGVGTWLMKTALIAAVLGFSWAANASAQQTSLSCSGTFTSYSKASEPLSSSIPPTSATIDLDRKTFTFMTGTWGITQVEPDFFFVESSSPDLVSQGRIDRNTGVVSIWVAGHEDFNKSTGMPARVRSTTDLSCVPAKRMF
jgi:hypothetical protein